MISFEEALSIVIDHAYPVSNERVPLQDSLNRILAENIYSDIDMPPFNKSAVDGFACRKDDISIGAQNYEALKVVETIPAGASPEKSILPGQCSRIMTGAMVPEGANCVIMVEQTHELPENRIGYSRSTNSDNICYKGEDIKKDDLVLEKGILIKPQHIAVLASTGAVNPLVAKRVTIAILSTGDELVEPEIIPTNSKIRNSNAMQLMAQVLTTGGIANYFGIAHDNKISLTSKLEKAMKSNEIVILTGGVSMGDFDYVPEVMNNLGIKIIFKSIAIQPGRPTVFGKSGDTFIFGLPGNPVSSFVLFELLVKPFIFKIMGHDENPKLIPLPMGVNYSRINPARKSMIPVKIINGEVHPLVYHGSAHINAYTEADGIISMEIGKTMIQKGEQVNVRQV